ncbi:MurR/RpiR family transcriptional regulator [Marinilactibacillus sp. GCM10026970]|uniref:MurR/RpiR family transcriptional regulator n=1 Tax=Marinilactibacillus sp. GCM10026970 TaxID=3252642 RepID=UPI00360D002D
MLISTALQEQKEFNNSEKTLADYILNHRESVLEFSIQTLAQQTFTSTSTIVRFCRKIGLKGYKDFKIKWSAELQKEYNEITNVNPDFPFTEDDTYPEIQKKILELLTESLHQTHAITSNERMGKAVDLLLNAKRIGIFAYGDTYLPALNFQNKLMKIDMPVQLSVIPGENRHLAANFGKEDCALILSYSGESKNNYFITNILKKNKAKILVISANPDSHIARLADLLLPVAKSESTSVKLSTFSSQAAIDFILNTLYGCIFVANYEKNHTKRIESETLLLDDRFDS